MPRIRLELPKEFDFSTQIQVRITDINYGGHVGNDKILTIIHEARIQFLKSFGYTEMQFEGTSLIMSDVAIEFKNELFFGDDLKVFVTTTDFSKVAFDIYYKLIKNNKGQEVIIAIAKTGMVCYNYDVKKVSSVPEKAINKLKSLS